jgi:cytochrome c553
MQTGRGALATVSPAVLAALLLIAVVASTDARAGGGAHGTPTDTQAELWAAGCAACHGMDGRGVGGFPALAGRQAGELLGLMLRQRAGAADTTIMHQHARGFSEAELARIAVVFAARP